jgi:protein-L-isoaspartate(D-aspartate) O-methyltransferase
MNRLEAQRREFAHLIATNARVPPTNSKLIEAFASVPRERFVGVGPWKIFTGAGYTETPTDDPALLYHDVVVSLKTAEGQPYGINNGQPTLHAAALSALAVKDGETVVHVGAGTGYYSAILATLTGPGGAVYAYEIDEELAAKAATNLAEYSHVRVHHRSGSEGELPSCDALYVNAGATDPLEVWLDALRPGGRLLFPLTPPMDGRAVGAMLLITREAGDHFAARFVCGAMFIPCAGARDEETGQKLAEAFKRGDLGKVRSLERGTSPGETCWCSGRGWWLST